jgi:uncharacterized lipoprotein YajG
MADGIKFHPHKPKTKRILKNMKKTMLMLAAVALVAGCNKNDNSSMDTNSPSAYNTNSAMTNDMNAMTNDMSAMSNGMASGMNTMTNDMNAMSNGMSSMTNSMPMNSMTNQ